MSILVFGSVASGHVDQFSDVDILVLCTPTIHSLADRQAALLQVGVDWRFDSPSDNGLFAAIDEDGRVDEIAVTVHYQEVAWIEAVLQEVLEQGAVTTAKLPFRPYTLPALLKRAWVIVDKDAKVAQWQKQAACYPDKLKQNILRRFLPILAEQTAELVATAKRDIGPRAFLFHLNWAVDAANSILYALNNEYDPADRRAERTVLPYLAKQPAAFSIRLNKVLEGPFDKQGARERAALFTEIAEDVLALAKLSLHER